MKRQKWRGARQRRRRRWTVEGAEEGMRSHEMTSEWTVEGETIDVDRRSGRAESRTEGWTSQRSSPLKEEDEEEEEMGRTMKRAESTE
jgi:hypothetical protein